MRICHVYSVRSTFFSCGCPLQGSWCAEWNTAHGQARERATGACKGQRRANQQAGGEENSRIVISDLTAGPQRLTLASGSCAQRLRAWLLSTTTNNTTMRHTMFLTMLAAALMGSGVANAAKTLYANAYNAGAITLGSEKTYDTLIVNEPLTLKGSTGQISLYNGATIEFWADSSAKDICSISTPAELTGKTVFVRSGSYNFKFNDDAQSVVAASAGKPITLIQDLNMASTGFYFVSTTPAQTTLTLNGAKAGETVELGGVQFTYVGPKAADYVFQTGEIGFTGYYDGSHNLSLVANGKPTPEPTTGTLSLLALAGLCIRRRK